MDTFNLRGFAVASKNCIAASEDPLEILARFSSALCRLFYPGAAPSLFEEFGQCRNALFIFIRPFARREAMFQGVSTPCAPFVHCMNNLEGISQILE